MTESPRSLFDQLNTIAEVDGLIASGQRESETLEYKSASKLFGDQDYSELAKDVSAFGIATERSDKTRPKQIEPVHPENMRGFLG
jgi:hypothetical protein